MAKPVAVTGSTGFIGSAVVRKLLLDGREVRAVIEPGAKTGPLEEIEREVGRTADRVTADVTDVAGMTGVLEGCESLYHLAAIYKTWMPDPKPLHRVNIEGTTATLLAAEKARLRKVVYTSSIAAVGFAKDHELANEDTPFNLFHIANDYILTKWQSERIALKFAEAGLPLVVVNPTFPFGPRDSGPTPTGHIVTSLLKAEVPALVPGGFNCIDVDDVAFGHVAAEEKGRVGERYILGDHNISLKDFFALVCELGNAKPPKLAVPKPVSAAWALGAEVWANRVSHKEPPATYKSVLYAQHNAWADVTKARRELGLPTTPLRSSLTRAIEWFRKAGMA